MYICMWLYVYKYTHTCTAQSNRSKLGLPKSTCQDKCSLHNQLVSNLHTKVVSEFRTVALTLGCTIEAALPGSARHAEFLLILL
jgi:hypothetical protein